VKQLLHT